MRFAVKGGIGDFLQCLPFMLDHPEHRYLVASHHDRVSEFFGTLGVEVEESLLGRTVGVEDCPRQTFFRFRDNPFPRRAPIFTDGRPVVGVHLGGSAYSVSLQQRFGLPSKVLPRAVLDALVAGAPQYNFLLFGSPSELDNLGEKENATPHLRLVRHEDAAVSLSCVAQCAALVGSDSAFKTMSAMLRIPTVVWVGGHPDEHRDTRFIDPYAAAGVMSVFRYWDLGDAHEVAAGVDFTLGRLRLLSARAA
jgi:hypothetical protein